MPRKTRSTRTASTTTDASRHARAARVVGREQIGFPPASYVGLNGFLLEYSGDLYRGIRGTTSAFYRALFGDGTVERSCREHGLAESWITDLIVPDHDADLVVGHERVSPQSYCVEWCPSMLRDAGVLTLDLAGELLECDCTLQDAYPWNVLFRDSEPVFVDLTSIVPIADRGPAIWPALDQFQSFVVRAPILAVDGKGMLARALLANNIDGPAVAGRAVGMGA